jgi:phage protein D
MTGSERKPGLPDSYYAPAFVVEVDGKPLDQRTNGDVLEVVVRMDLDKLTSAELKLNNYDDQTFDLKWTDSDAFAIGKSVHVRLGYADRLISVMRGYITTLTPDFPSDQAPTLGVGAIDALAKLNHSKPPEDKVTYKKVRDYEIAQEIARRHDIQIEVTKEGPRHELIVQENKDDAVFLRERARLIDFDVFMRTDPKTKKDKLHFVSPKDGRGPESIRTYVLRWGTLRNSDVSPNLIEFKPTITAGSQVKSVTVRGWDPDKKQAIVAKATPDNTKGVRGRAKKTGPDAAAEIASGSGREDVVVDRPVASQDEALALARALLARRSYEFHTAKGKLIGLPDLQPDDNIEVHGVGTRFGGLYHVTKVTHTLNDKGYVTEFEARGSQVTNEATA